MTRYLPHISFVAFFALASGCHLLNDLGDNAYNGGVGGMAGTGGMTGSGGVTTTNSGGSGGTGGMGMCPEACGDCEVCVGVECVPGQPGDECGTGDAHCDTALACVDGAAEWLHLFGNGANQTGVGIAARTSTADPKKIEIAMAGTVTAPNAITFPNVTLGSSHATETDLFVGVLDDVGVPQIGIDLLASGNEGDVSDQGLAALSRMPSDGGFAIGGEYDGVLFKTPVTGKAGYVARLDNDLGLMWTAIVASTVSAGIADVHGATAGVYVTGTFDGDLNLGGLLKSELAEQDAILAAYQPIGGGNNDALGVVKWAHDFTGATMGTVIKGTGVSTDADGNVIFVGTYKGSASLGLSQLVDSGSSTNFYVAKLTSDGTLVWLKSFGALLGNQEVHDVATSGNDIVVVGGYDGALYVDATEAAGMADENLELNVGGSDVFVIRLNSDGDVVFGDRHSSPGVARATTVVVDPSGNIVLAGDFEDKVVCGVEHQCEGTGTDAFLFKLTSDGKRIWTKSFGAPDTNDVINSVSISPTDGGVLIAGTVTGTLTMPTDPATVPPTAPGGGDVFIGRFAP